MAFHIFFANLASCTNWAMSLLITQTGQWIYWLHKLGNGSADYTNWAMDLLITQTGQWICWLRENGTTHTQTTPRKRILLFPLKVVLAYLFSSLFGGENRKERSTLTLRPCLTSAERDSRRYFCVVMYDCSGRNVSRRPRGWSGQGPPWTVYRPVVWHQSTHHS